MSIGRVLMLAGSVSASAGAAGLIFFGLAPVRVFEVMTVRVTAEGTDPLPSALDQFLPAAICALLLAVGLMAASAGAGMPSRRQSITFIGRGLLVLGGVGVVSAGIPVFLGLFGMQSSFSVMAASATLPKVEELRTVLDINSAHLTTGYIILLISMALPLMASLIGFQRRPTDRWFAVAPLLPAAIAALGGLCYIVLSFLCWMQSGTLGEMFTTGGSSVKPSELAGSLSAILTMSLIGCPLLILMGLVLAMAGLLAPRAKRDY